MNILSDIKTLTELEKLAIIL